MIFNVCWLVFITVLQNNLDKMSVSTDENVKLTPSKVALTSSAVVDKSVPKEVVRSVTSDEKNLVRMTVLC